jgi:hypothetical protein
MGYLVPPVNADDAFGLLHGTSAYDTFFVTHGRFFLSLDT